jgi:hypothetical protein
MLISSVAGRPRPIGLFADGELLHRAGWLGVGGLLQTRWLQGGRGEAGNGRADERQRGLHHLRLVVVSHYDDEYKLRGVVELNEK